MTSISNRVKKMEKRNSRNHQLRMKAKSIKKCPFCGHLHAKHSNKVVLCRGCSRTLFRWNSHDRVVEDMYDKETPEDDVVKPVKSDKGLLSKFFGR